jgi:hypothetical protein
MLVQPDELKTELYPEIIDAITRSDDAQVIIQIKAAEDFVKGYLFKYDLKALLGTETIAPTVIDENLKKVIKIIACYWLVRKANPNVSLDLFREDWMLMIGTKDEPGWLTEIKNGHINPDWPYKPDDLLTTNVDESQINSDVHWGSNYKRINRF